MSVQSEITRLKNAKAAIKAAIEGKGVTVPDTTLLDGMAAMIESIEAGGGAEVSTGTFMLDTDIEIYGTDGYAILHGLSNSPEIFILLRLLERSDAGKLRYYVYYKYMTSGHAIYGGTQSNGYSGISYITPTITAETVTIISDNSRINTLSYATEYVWVAVRGVP